MNDAQIETLKEALKTGIVLWCPDSTTARQVRKVGIAPTLKDEEPEPSEVAFFHNNEYAALYNCGLSDFVCGRRL